MVDCNTLLLSTKTSRHVLFVHVTYGMDGQHKILFQEINDHNLTKTFNNFWITGKRARSDSSSETGIDRVVVPSLCLVVLRVLELSEEF